LGSREKNEPEESGKRSWQFCSLPQVGRGGCRPGRRTGKHPVAVSRAQLPPSAPRSRARGPETAAEEVHPYPVCIPRAVQIWWQRLEIMGLCWRRATWGAGQPRGTPAEVWWQQAKPRLQWAPSILVAPRPTVGS